MATVTKADLIDAVRDEVRVTRHEAAELVDGFIEMMAERLSAGETVKISSFGTFMVRDKGPRMGRNPKTGEPAPVSPRRVAVFRPSGILKRRVEKAAAGTGRRHRPSRNGDAISAQFPRQQTRERTMDQGSSSGIDESTLTKGQVRKLRALRKSVGEEIGEQAFAAWLSSQSGAGEEKADGNAATVVDTLWPLVEQGSLAIPRGGYIIRRGRGRIIVEPARS